jgi:hypothetical protein
MKRVGAMLLVALLFAAAPARADEDEFGLAREAAEAGQHREALRHYQKAYDDPRFASSQTRIAKHAAVSAAAAGQCAQMRRWIKLTDKESLPAADRRALTSRCTPPPERAVQPIIIPETPPAAAPKCPEGQFLTEAGCCPDGTRLSADKAHCEPLTGTLVLRSNLDGALLSGLPESAVFDGGPAAGRAVPVKGFHLPKSDVRLTVPIGSYTLTAFYDGDPFHAITQEVAIRAAAESRQELDWEPQWKGDHSSFVKFADGSRLSPTVNSRAVGALLGGIALLAGSAALYGTCGASVGHSCDAAWQEGLSYTAASLTTLFGLIFTGVGVSLLHEPRPAAFTDADKKPIAATR